ncbi:alpha/beta-hydrolase [Trichoderma citrinoviride]|uniref:Alpha/beta-hydrolase n=1 Tax=Trichoderma citrinoviride TaxID=58853 RepID=A0A2T4BNI1_9HYPO|nr:alpha/beta-hydrolase [Trichoderma citrinoviride]PTB70850.1 alpha/beta-hydrolase [Trichoderma citrinoviride]
MACPDCFRGSIHEGEPRGKVTHAYGLETYVVEPSDGQPPKGIVVVLPDAFGWTFVNVRLLADKYADMGGFKVYAPELMNGWSAPLWMLDSMKMVSSPSSGILTKIYHSLRVLRAILPVVIYNWPSRAYPKVKGFFEQLRKEEGSSLPVGAAGFCWGGKQVVLLGRGDTIDGRPLIDAGFAGHPSLLSLPSEMEALKVPVSFAIGDHDEWISVEQAGRMREIVEAKEESARGEVAVYPQTAHGFCLRADHTFEKSERQADEAAEQCVKWFTAHFKAS